MSYKVYIEMPLGNCSHPHEFFDEAEARKMFDGFVGQMRPWKKFRAAVIFLTENDKELDRVEIANA